MTVTQADLEAVLTRAAPAALHGRVPALAAVLTGLANGTLSPEGARAALADESELIDSLTGAERSVSVGRTVVDFKGAVAGSVSMGDVAGRDVYKISVTVGAGVSVGIADRTPLDFIEAGVAGRLKGADAKVLRDAGAILGVELSGADEDMRWVLARKLLRADLAAAVKAVATLSSQLCAGAGEVLAAVAPFVCVDPAAVKLVRTAVDPGRRGLGLRSGRVETARTVASASSWEHPRWNVQEVPGGWGSFDELRAQVASAVEEAIGYPPDDLDQELEALTVVLVFPPPVLTPGDVQALRDSGYGKATFLFLTGEMVRAEFDALGLPDVEYVLPEVDPVREAGDEREIRRAVRNAERACASGGG